MKTVITVMTICAIWGSVAGVVLFVWKGMFDRQGPN